MLNHQALPKIFVLLSLLLLADLTLIESVYAQRGGTMSASKDTATVPMIKLQKKFFKPLKFTYGDSKPRKVFGYFTFDSSFKNVMAKHPAALREIKRCYPYMAIQTAGWITLLASITKNLIVTFKQANAVSSGKLIDDGAGVNDLVLPIVAGTAIFTSAAIGSAHLRKGIKIFNEKQTQVARATSLTELSNPKRRGSPRIGVKFGINSANVNRKDTKSNGGLVAGAFFVQKFNGFLSVQPEVSFSMKGYQSREFDFVVDLNYLEIPLLAKLSIPTRSSFHPSFWIGPSLGIKLGSKAVYEGSSYSLERFEKIKSTDWGITFGLGARIGNSPFTLSVMSTSGLTSNNEDFNEKNRVFSIVIGAAF